MLERRCNATGLNFNVSDVDLRFLERVSPRVGGKKFLVPPPTLSPLARFQRRLAHRNQIYMFLRPSSSGGKIIPSMYPDDVPFPVIELEEWLSDSWDPCEFGRPFDFSRPFFDQFAELQQVVPRANITTAGQEDCYFSNHTGWAKTTYFGFNTNFNRDCMFIETCDYSVDCLDCSRCIRSELCFDCVECSNCYSLQSSDTCEHCSDGYFLLNCRNCRYCFGCVNLRQAEYRIFNKQVSKEEYQTFLDSLDLSSYQQRKDMREKIDEFQFTQPRPHMVGNLIENGSGNYLNEVQRVFDSYAIRDAQDLRYCFGLFHGARDCYDVTMFGQKIELSYEALVCGHEAVEIRFSHDCWVSVSDLNYCDFCSGSSHCFGCSRLRRKKYCILNKAFTKHEYENLFARIVTHMQETGEWGEFFPEWLSPFPYNLSLAQRYFPRSREELERVGEAWFERPIAEAHSGVLPWNLPDKLTAENSSIDVRQNENQAAFRITKKEIKFLRKIGAPLPREPYDIRMQKRQARVGGVVLESRRCEKSDVALQTTYSEQVAPHLWDREQLEKEY